MIYEASQRSDGDRGSLEDEQSPSAEKRRGLTEGRNADLTELAAGQVVEEQQEGDDLEREESQAEQDFEDDKDQGAEALAEVAAPAPLPHDASECETPRHQSDEESLRPVAPVVESRFGVWSESVAVAWLIFFSLLGTLARLGVETLATYPYSAVPSPVLWANMGGSLFLGFLIEDRRLFRYLAEPHSSIDDPEKLKSHTDKNKKILPLYIGLATGFCGSFTSFSTFITDSYLALSNSLPPADPTSPYHTVGAIQPRNGAYSFMEVVAMLILHPAVSISALKTGAHLAVGMERFTPSMPARLISRFLDPLALALGFGCWIGAILLSIWPPSIDWRSRVTMALVFAPPAFPLGTFVANIFGTWVEGMCYDLQHARDIAGNVTPGRANSSCAVLEGVMQGFCGCTTTVSTWVVELNSLRRHHAWIYGAASVGIALGSQVAIIGSFAWSVGFSGRCRV